MSWRPDGEVLRSPPSQRPALQTGLEPNPWPRPTAHRSPRLTGSALMQTPPLDTVQPSHQPGLQKLPRGACRQRRPRSPTAKRCVAARPLALIRTHGKPLQPYRQVRRTLRPRVPPPEASRASRAQRAEIRLSHEADWRRPARSGRKPGTHEAARPPLLPVQATRNRRAQHCRTARAELRLERRPRSKTPARRPHQNVYCSTRHAKVQRFAH